MSIQIKKISETEFEVSVEAAASTTHRVTLTPSYHEDIAGDTEVTPELLIEKSFEFLLAREPNTSILRSFDLPVIESYFPDYRKIIAGMLR